jgi:hypothetical protein
MEKNASSADDRHRRGLTLAEALVPRIKAII